MEDSKKEDDSSDAKDSKKEYSSTAKDFKEHTIDEDTGNLKWKEDSKVENSNEETEEAANKQYDSEEKLEDTIEESGRIGKSIWGQENNGGIVLTEDLKIETNKILQEVDVDTG